MVDLEECFRDVEWDRLYDYLGSKQISAKERIKSDKFKLTGLTIQTCSKCGHNQLMPNDTQIFVCEKCGLRINRYVNYQSVNEVASYDGRNARVESV